MSEKISLAVAGSNGRMGARITELAGKAKTFDIAAALHESAPLENLSAHVLVDFTHPTALSKHLKACRDQNIALVLGTTGLSAAQENEIKAAAQDIAIVYSANFSIGVNLLAVMAEKISSILDETYDIEITEAHHRHKKDAPSGTALMLGKAAAKGRNIDFDAHAVFSRDGECGARTPGDIGFSVLRGGEIAGEHSLMFLGDSERIELTHKAADRDIFAHGALKAAHWIVTRKPGLYTMRNVLNLS